MKNTLLDLNNHLFAQLEKISDESITTDDKLDFEIKRTEKIIGLSEVIIKNAALNLESVKTKAKLHEISGEKIVMPKMLED